MLTIYNKRDLLLIQDALVESANSKSNKAAQMAALELQTTGKYIEIVRDLQDTIQLIKATVYHLEKWKNNE